MACGVWCVVCGVGSNQEKEEVKQSKEEEEG
jgi:hypothetical protein